MDDTLDLVTLSWCLGEIREALTHTESPVRAPARTRASSTPNFIRIFWKRETASS